MKTWFADAWNGLRHRRTATLVSVAGLTLAFTASLMVALLAIALSSLDPTIPDPERTVVLDFKGNPPGQPSPWFTASPVSFGTMLKARGVPLDLITRTSHDGMDVTMGDRIEQVFPLLVDPDAVPLFQLKALAGDLRATLASRDGVAVTPHLVRRLWGDVPPSEAMGKTLQVRGLVYTVTAVIPEFDPRHPLDNSAAMAGRPHDLLAGFESQANSKSEADRHALYMVNGRVYARLQPGGSAEQVGGWMQDAFEASPLYQEIPPDWRTGRQAAYFRAVPLTRLPFEGEANEMTWLLAGALSAACTLLLTLAAFNHMNLQAASLLQRQRETALRRSLGADGWALIRLWALEALLPLLAAAACALLLAWWVAPAAAGWLNLPATLPVADPLPPQAIAGLIAVVLVLWPLTLAAPAWLALRRPTAPALQGRTASEGPWGRRVRQGLLAVQLGGALLLLSLAGVLAAQQQHLLHADRGFDTRNRVWLGVLINPEQVPNLDAFTAALDRHPAVLHWAMSDMRPARDVEGQKELIVSASRHKQVLRISSVSPGFFDTWGMTLLAGQPKVAHGETAMVIDAKAARLLGFADPQAAVGAQVSGGGGFLQEGQDMRRVVAVVKDVKLESAREPALPQGFLLTDKPQWDLSIHGTDLATLHQAVEELWTAHGPKVAHVIQSADQQLGEVYQMEAQFTAMLATVALLAVGVSMSAAYALVADTLRRRRTELVLHRLHGANNLAIARQVMAEFAGPLLIAALFSLPLSAWLGELYLSDFVERVDHGLGLVAPLAAASIATLLVTALAALRHVRLALALQPIEALR